MKASFEAEYHRVEDYQWWCKARREIVLRLVCRHIVNPDARILELGCSSGALLVDLKNAGYNDVSGIDLSDVAIGVAKERGLANVSVMNAASLAFPDSSFDVLIASDVLEHIDDDAAAAHECYRVLRPNGWFIIFVPAFRQLWSRHDEVNQHVRRYNARELSRLLHQPGFIVDRLSYWNFLLTMPNAALAMMRKLAPGLLASRSTGGLITPVAPINQLLLQLLRIENHLLEAGDLPFGTSVFALARKA